MTAQPQFVPVKEDPSLRRDGSNGAIINRNSNDYFRRLAIKKSEKSKKSELESLRSEVAELKDLVRQLISQQNANLSKE